MAITFNIKVFRQEIADQITKDRGLIDVAYNQANAEFINEKQSLVQEFENDSITQEIRAGPEADNSSGTLSREGNLYSFIGFDPKKKEERDPTEVISQMLKNDVKLIQKSLGARYARSFVTYEFPIFYPTESEIFAKTPMPFGTSRSWVRGIIHGISNFNYYLYLKTEYGQKNQKLFTKYSRSGTGLQFEKWPINFGGTFTPKGDRYVIGMLKRFLQKFRK